jgi:4-amino-4-deoxy-L-arabinose transferase-like glycosyltransferase
MPSRQPLILLFLFVVAFAARVACAPLDDWSSLGGDELEYDTLARGLLNNHAYSGHPGFSPLLYSATPYEPTAFRSPGLPFVLAAIYRTTGGSHMAARLFLAAISALGAVLVALIARRIHRLKSLSLLAGVVWALWPAGLYYSGTHSMTLSTEALAVPLLLLALLALITSLQRASMRALFAAGVLLGLAALTRSNLVLMLPFALLWLPVAWTRRWGGRPAVSACLVLTFAFALTVVPWMTRNYSKLGVFTIATQREPLYLGNNAWARGSYDGRIEPDPFHPVIPQHVLMLEKYPGFLDLSETKKASLYKKEAIRYALDNKARMLWLTWRKLLIFFLPIHEVRGTHGYSWAYATIAPFALVGAVRAVRKRRMELLLLLAPFGVVLATSVLVLAMPRYRYPGEPGLIILAAYGLTALLARYRPRNVYLAASTWLVMNCGAALVFSLRS